MPEIKNTFLKSKMNKDLDARLVPNGQYRDARNVSISRSEGADVGALENVLGNKAITTLKTKLGYLEDTKNNLKYDASDGDVILNGLEIIGYFMDVTNDRIFLFLTDYIDSSNDQLSNFAPGDIITTNTNPLSTVFNAKGAACYIVQYNIKPENIINDFRVLVAGNFLNFSKTHPIINVNFIEGLLFFTDNRNQPRKINVDFAFNNSYELSGASDPYYYTEDQISVAKFAPFASPSFLDTSNNSGLLDVSNEYLGAHIANTLSATTGSGGTTFNLNGGNYNITGNNPDIQGGGADVGDLIVFPEQDNNNIGGSFASFGTVTPSGSLSNDTYRGVTGQTAGFTAKRGGNVMGGLQLDITITVANNTVGQSGVIVNSISKGFHNGDTVEIDSSVVGGNGIVLTLNKLNMVDKAIELEIQTAGAAAVTTVNAPGVPVGEDTLFFIKRRNPFYDENYPGDDRVIKDKFARFSYRFKYDDGEYSIMAPFTQAAFVPNQFGYFIGEDEQKTLKSGDVDFFENSVTKVKLNILLPFRRNQIEDKLKVKEIQILAKNSDELAVRVVEDVPVSKISSSSSFNYVYDYLSSKPIKALPEADLIRVSDKIPIRALTQEIVANRVVYGNYVEKHATPDYLRYDVKYRKKTYPSTNNPADIVNRNFTNEFLTHNVKQDRTYQIGVVLFDRYGRASNVVFSDPEQVTADFSNSTISTAYSNFGVDSVNFWGNYLSFLLNSPIPESDKVGYPGLYSETNPLGYYSYRIVIKQQEQEYYNVYTPGVLAGQITWSTVGKSGKTTGYNIGELLPQYDRIGKFSNISLQGDNINKIPRDLKEVNANDTDFSSSVLLFNRVNTDKFSTTSNNLNFKYFNVQNEKANKKPSKVTSIIPFKDLGEWTKKKGSLFNGGRQQTSTNQGNTDEPKPNPWYPYFLDTQVDSIYHFADIFFNSTKNPFIATIETDFQIGLEPTYTSGSNQDKRKAIEAAWQSLAVFETDPVKSNLEIYYESSSSGLISELNTDTALAVGPFSLRDAAGNDTSTGDLEFFANENMAVGEPVTTYFEAFDTNGNACADNTNTITIHDVRDGNNQYRGLDFDIEQKPGGGINQRLWRLKTNTEFTFVAGSNVIESYTFVLNVTANGITNKITLNNCRLANTKPIVSSIFTHGPTGPFTISTIPKITATVGGIQYNDLMYNGALSPANNAWNFDILRFTTKNGSANTQRDEEQLVCEVFEGITGGGFSPSDFFSIGHVRSDGTAVPYPQFCIIPNSSAILDYFNNNLSQQFLILTGFKVKAYDADKTVTSDVTQFPQNNSGATETRTIIFSRT
tara:strand:+ start:30 stop:3965 length:3936 start_codon:yes stop_codon:yes gene_type:complete